MRGRKPKPTEVRVLEGNPGKRPLPDPVAIGGRPEKPPDPPVHLGDDGKRFWTEAVVSLHELGILDRCDGPALEMAAVAYDRWHQARRTIAKQGLMARGSAGQIVEHPMASTERKEALIYLRFAEQYGLTASARARLGISMLQGQSLAASMASELGETEFTPA